MRGSGSIVFVDHRLLHFKWCCRSITFYNQINLLTFIFQWCTETTAKIEVTSELSLLLILYQPLPSEKLWVGSAGVSSYRLLPDSDQVLALLGVWGC